MLGGVHTIVHSYTTSYLLSMSYERRLSCWLQPNASLISSLNMLHSHLNYHAHTHHNHYTIYVPIYVPCRHRHPPIKIISRDDLVVTAEEKVFEAVAIWLLNKVVTRSKRSRATAPSAQAAQATQTAQAAQATQTAQAPRRCFWIRPEVSSVYGFLAAVHPVHHRGDSDTGEEETAVDTMADTMVNTPNTPIVSTVALGDSGDAAGGAAAEAAGLTDAAVVDTGDETKGGGGGGDGEGRGLVAGGKAEGAAEGSDTSATRAALSVRPPSGEGYIEISRSTLATLLKAVRFPLMSPAYLYEVVEKILPVSEVPAMEALLYEAYRFRAVERSGRTERTERIEQTEQTEQTVQIDLPGAATVTAAEGRGGEARDVIRDGGVGGQRREGREGGGVNDGETKSSSRESTADSCGTPTHGTHSTHGTPGVHSIDDSEDKEFAVDVLGGSNIKGCGSDSGGNGDAGRKARVKGGKSGARKDRQKRRGRTSSSSSRFRARGSETVLFGGIHSLGRIYDCTPSRNVSRHGVSNLCAANDRYWQPLDPNQAHVSIQFERMRQIVFVEFKNRSSDRFSIYHKLNADEEWQAATEGQACGASRSVQKTVFTHGEVRRPICCTYGHVGHLGGDTAICVPTHY